MDKVSIPIRTDLVAGFVLRKYHQETQLLLLQRPPDCSYAPLTWQVVYGHLDSNESTDAAILREIGEETGLSPYALYITKEVFSIFRQGSQDIVLVPVYAAFVDFAVEVKLNNEHVAFKWVNVEKADKMLIWPAQKRALQVVREVFCDREPPEVYRIV